MENAVRDGASAKAGRKINIEDVIEVAKSAESVNLRFQDGAFVALKPSKLKFDQNKILV